MTRLIWLVGIIIAVSIAIGLTMRDRSREEVRPAAETGESNPSDAAAAAGSEANSPVAQLTEVKGDANRPAEVLTAGYVSSDACLRCHESEHQSWHASFHRTMSQPVSPETAPAAIEETEVTVDGQDYRFVRHGDRYFVQFDDLIEPGPAMVEKELVLMTGSHHMTVFWYETKFGRTPAMLPIVYLHDQQRWILRTSSFVQPPAENDPELARWNQVCSRCHSTHPRARYDSSNEQWDTHVAEFGIACEACHGPGEGHIRYHDDLASGTFREEKAEMDDVLVSPAELPHELRSDVCGHCHSIHRPDFESYDRQTFWDFGMPFRPGDDLEESPLRVVLRATPEAEGTRGHQWAMKDAGRHNSFWPDGTIRVAGREYNGLIESPCYQNGTMSCLSCHEMHPDESVDLNVWRDDQLKAGMRTNQACVQCHTEPRFTTEVETHTHHLADSHGSECMNCHMPHSTYGLLKSSRSHRIENPSVQTTIQTGRPNGCVLCHLDKSLSWTADHLSDWYGQPELELQTPLANETASGLVNLLMGDAGLRAIYASAFRWQPAQEASGSDWMPPYLALGLMDEYDAVRLISRATLQSLPGYEDLAIDEFASPEERAEWVNQFLKDFRVPTDSAPRAELLIKPDGSVDFSRAAEMFNRRDQRPIFLQE